MNIDTIYLYTHSINEEFHQFNLKNQKYNDLISDIAKTLVNNFITDKNIVQPLYTATSLCRIPYTKYIVETNNLIQGVKNYKFYLSLSQSAISDAVVICTNVDESEFVKTECPMYIAGKDNFTTDLATIIIMVQWDQKNNELISSVIDKVKYKLSHEFLHVYHSIDSIIKNNNTNKILNKSLAINHNCIMEGIITKIQNQVAKDYINDSIEIAVPDYELLKDYNNYTGKLDDLNFHEIMLGCMYYLDASEFSARLESFSSEIKYYNIQKIVNSNNYLIYCELYKLIKTRKYELQELYKKIMQNNNYKDIYNEYLKFCFSLSYIPDKDKFNINRLLKNWQKRCEVFKEKCIQIFNSYQ